MTNIDQFESVFRAANKERFALQPFSLDRILVVTDLPEPNRRRSPPKPRRCWTTYWRGGRATGPCVVPTTMRPSMRWWPRSQRWDPT